LAWSVVALAALVVACFDPSALTAWLAGISLLGVLVLGAAESIAVGRIAVRPSGQSSFFFRHFVLTCILIYTAAIGAGACLLMNFGTQLMRGEGMSPVINPGELLLYHKRVVATDLVPGKVFSFGNSADSSWGRPGDVVIARILAGPGDALAIREKQYEVNGKDSGIEVSPVGHFRVVVNVPEAPEQIKVPPDCYFVVQEQPPRALDSRTLSWARRPNVIATKLWLVSSRGLGKPLE
jgi:signal peptidase I